MTNPKVVNPTVLETEKIKERAKAEFSEVLEATGQENEAEGSKWVMEVERAKEKDAEKNANREKEFLEASRKKKEAYTSVLANVLRRIVSAIEWPATMSWNVTSNSVGVLIEVHDKTLKRYTRAFRVSGDLKYDFHAVHVLGIQAENLVDKLTGVTPLKTTSGIILPDNYGKKHLN